MIHKIQTFKPEQCSAINKFLDDNEQVIHNIHITEKYIAIETKEPFSLKKHIEQELKGALEELGKEEYRLACLDTYTHLTEDKTKGAKETMENNVKTLKAKIKLSEEWLVQNS
jgi:hypothetical protein